MAKELKEEFSSNVKIGDRLNVVNSNILAKYSFLINYKNYHPNDNGGIYFIDDEMNIVVVENNKNIYNRVFIENVRNRFFSNTTKVKCDVFNNILMGSHKAFFNEDKINYDNRPNNKVDYHVISTNVFGSTRISKKLAQLTQKIRN